MTPTRIYVRSVLALHRTGLLKAAAHITGGGLPGNVPRVLPAGMVAALEPVWAVPQVFRWLARTGGVRVDEMVRVFNCGLGMVLVVADTDADAAMTLLTEKGETVCRIGAIESGKRPSGEGEPAGESHQGTAPRDYGGARISFTPPADWLA